MIVKQGQVVCTGLDDRGRYQYQIYLHLQNVGKSNLTVITKTSDVLGIFYEVPEITLSNSESTVDGGLLVPSAEELGLVTLYPTDVASVHDTFTSSDRLQDKAVINYLAREIYSGRFGNWVGSAKSAPIQVVNSVKSCIE
ncbi:hypothetical protein [Corallincola spongiicola]|uniref:Uncharacterized protein n=1 Tax=Corallincola spongiicola TaxID=2520508 RepID=A0ABY1WT31_9GAMM|nr:hypothetical protein [Corallincola spongiicola]TAA47890.1 hypothetical protein EXY25_01180 [Corallincola spongiicola]